MKLIILNAKNRYRPQDLKRLEDAGAIFYEQKGNKLEDIKEMYEGEDFVLGVQPDRVEGVWEGLPWEKVKELKNLKGLCLCTTAYGWVPFKELGEIGVPVTNVPGKSTDAVGEYYVFMMTALLRRLPYVIKNNWSHSYEPEVLGTDAKGLTVGIIGLGQIGRKIADLCAGYGMNVIYWSQNKKECPYKYEEIDKVCKDSDVLFITTVADASTANLIDKVKIDSMKKTAIILSPVDTIVYDKPYILEKVSNNELGGFGFESDKEKIADFKGNVFPAPEIGYYTQQTLDKESQIMTDSILSVLQGKPINAVNL